MKALLGSRAFIENGTCEQLKAFAFKSHPDCYVDHGFCHDIFPSYRNFIAMFVLFFENLSPIVRSFKQSMIQVIPSIW